MYQLCRHIKTNGKRCQSPALGELAYCYFHARTHTMATTNYTVFDDLKLPLLEDSASIQVAISRVINAFVSARIDARRTGLLLYAIQIASQNIDRASSREDSETVRSMTVTAKAMSWLRKWKYAKTAIAQAAMNEVLAMNAIPKKRIRSRGPQPNPSSRRKPNWSPETDR